MTLTLYGHPLSSYCQKALTAFYEHDLAVEIKLIDGSEPVASAFAELWPIKRFPILTDGDRLIVEATTIIEYIDLKYPGPSRAMLQQPPRSFPPLVLPEMERPCSTPWGVMPFGASSLCTSMSCERCLRGWC